MIPLRVLVVEDNPLDAELVLREVRHAGYEPIAVRVETESAYLAELASCPDIILSDYQMPEFTGQRALALLRERALEIPFIIISGTIGEDVAVEVMREGATDYLLKDRLARLGVSIQHALDQGILRRERARADEALLKSERELRELTAALELERSHLAQAQAVAKMGSWVTELETLKVTWSDETYRIFETTPERFQPTHQGFLEFVHPDDRAVVDQAFKASMAEDDVQMIEHRLVMADGRIKFVEERWQVVKDTQGTPVRAIGTCLDTTERRRAAEELRWKTAFFEAQVDATLDGVLVVDPQGHKILQNQRFTELLKIPQHIADERDDTAQLQWVATAARDPGAFVERVTYLYAHPDEVNRDEIELKDGTVLDRYSSPVKGNDGTHYGRIWTFHDITQRKATATALLESKRFLQSTLNALTSHIAILDEHGTIVEVNAAWDGFAERNSFNGSHRGVGDNYLHLCDGATGPSAEEAAPVAAGIRAVMAGTTDEFELEYPCHSPQEQRWFVVRVTRFRGDGPMRVVVAHENITARKQAELAMRESEARFRQLADHIQEVFWVTDVAKQKVLYVSRAYEAIWGRSGESLIADAKDWMDAIHPDDRERVINAAMTKQVNGTYDEEYRIIRPDLTQRWIRDRAFPVRNAAGEVYRIVGIAKDITERRVAREKLHEQASLLDKARDAILVRDLDHRVTFWNQGAERLYGWAASDAMGRKVSEMLYSDVEDFRIATEATLENGEWQGELQHVTKDGKPILVEARWTLVRDDAGQPKSILSINSDITERKVLEQQFFRVQRMENIGTLAGGIAHDLNNVLAPIMMSIELLRMTSRDNRMNSVLTTIETSAKRGADMVRQILTFARGAEGKRSQIDSRRAMADIEHLIRETFPKALQIKCTIDRDLPPVLGDATQLHQVLLNLCVNARDAMPDNGTLTLAASAAIVDAYTAALHPEAKAGLHLLIRVSDTGTGIPSEVLEKIFDPFFTTKEVGKGTGLGLSTVLAIIKSHGGFIEVETAPGKGTTFAIYLPAVPVPEGKTFAMEVVALPQGNEELIMVVDDDVAVRTITRQVLEAFGYRVLEAGDGTVALALFIQHQAEIAVVITDLMMPVMDGIATIQVLKRIAPEVKVIAGSGVVTDQLTTQMASLGVQHFLPKPYSTTTILMAVNDVIRNRPPTAKSASVP